MEPLWIWTWSRWSQLAQGYVIFVASHTTLTDVFEGLMGIANAQRSLDYIRIITEFITQPQYAPVVPMFGMPSHSPYFEVAYLDPGIVNEPFVAQLDRTALENL
jgi:hypothetical protein